MKKQIVFFLLLLISTSTFSQKDTLAQTFNNADYLKKSKKQNTTGWILLGSGFAVAAAGIITGVNGSADELVGIFTGEESNKFETGSALIFIGAATMLGSIPFFIASSKNKRKANELTLSLKLENRSWVQKNSIVRSGYPAISVKLNL
jgi:hypothetical protein